MISQPGRPVQDRLARSAAWALRRLGNQGHRDRGDQAGPDKPRSRPSVAGRPGSSPTSSRGWTRRVDLADRLIARASDPDLWTRLQALRSLRQWFYRSNDPAFRRRVVDAYLARMAEPDEPVVRKALVEGMYILLDENLGGGVGLQKNLASLPEKFRKVALEGRKAVERDVLLGPILDALETGNALQREALVRSFDGSFFQGRTYARQPSGMLDVGNDREFGFLESPPPDRLDRAFAALLASDATPEVRRRSIQLARFFDLPAITNNATILAALGKEPDRDRPAASEAPPRIEAGSRPAGPVGELRRPWLSTFRDRINPLFVEPGGDGHSCASCHATHSALRIEAGGGADPVRTNFESALKLIDLDDPESSPLLRKPRSPIGDGSADKASPTGLTHVGGPRWDGTDHPAYRAILDWIRESSTATQPRGEP